MASLRANAIEPISVVLYYPNVLWITVGRVCPYIGQPGSVPICVAVAVITGVPNKVQHLLGCHGQFFPYKPVQM